MKYGLRHTTVYDYDADVSTSYGRAHLLPRERPGQQVLSAELEISPAPAEQYEHVDFFGNRSCYFAVREAHTTLRVTSDCVLQIDRETPNPGALDAVSWEQARDSLASNDPARQFLLPSGQVAISDDVRDYARQALTAGRGFGSAIVDLTNRIYQDFKYKAGTTTVQSTLDEVLAKRSGVCQDFAHLAVGSLRAMGLAARYVSGYLETVPPPGQAKLQGADASHAWASVLLPGSGWIDFDPTNNQFVDHRYLILAHGRDYADVPPLKGVIMTDAKTSTMRVSVDVTPLE